MFIFTVNLFYTNILALIYQSVFMITINNKKKQTFVHSASIIEIETLLFLFKKYTYRRKYQYKNIIQIKKYLIRYNIYFFLFPIELG